MVGCWRCTCPSIHLFRLKIAVGCLTSTYPSIHLSAGAASQDHGRLPAVQHIQAFARKARAGSQDHGRLPAVHASMWAEITLCGHHLRPSLFPSPPPQEKIKKYIYIYNQGNLGRTHRTKTHSTKTTAQENRTHVTTDKWDMFF